MRRSIRIRGAWCDPMAAAIPQGKEGVFEARNSATTELNGVFYRTPTVEAVAAWCAEPRTISCSPGSRCRCSGQGRTDAVPAGEKEAAAG